MKQLDKAEQNILLAKQRAPNNLEVIYYEATIYEDEGRMDDSIRVLSEAVTAVKSESEFAPSRRRTLAILYQQLGQLYREASNYTAAVNTFEEMLRLGSRGRPPGAHMIVDTYRDAREISKALDAAHKAVDAYPKDHSIRITQALLLGRKCAGRSGRVATSRPAGRLARRLRSSAGYRAGLRTEQALGGRGAAIHAAEKLQSDSQGKEMTGFLMGAIFERQKKFDQAEYEFRKVLELNPRNSSTLNYYGYMLADRGMRLEEATDMIKRALVEEPGSAAYKDSLGWAYYKQGKLPEAEEMLRQALEPRKAHDPTILSHLGDIYAKMGKDSLAEAQWQKSVDEWHRVLARGFRSGQNGGSGTEDFRAETAPGAAETARRNPSRSSISPL